jgi:hypothetical protein
MKTNNRLSAKQVEALIDTVFGPSAAPDERWMAVRVLYMLLWELDRDLSQSPGSDRRPPTPLMISDRQGSWEADTLTEFDADFFRMAAELALSESMTEAQRRGALHCLLVNLANHLSPEEVEILQNSKVEISPPGGSA